MMSNLVSLYRSLDSCRFYVEAMLAAQYGSTLPVIPDYHHLYEDTTADHELHQRIDQVLRTFDSIVARSDLKFSIKGVLYRFRSIYGRYCAQYPDSVLPPQNLKDKTAIPQAVIPILQNQESLKDFSYRYYAHTGEQVRSFIWLACLIKYADEQTDVDLPWGPEPFEQPDQPRAREFLTGHGNILRSLNSTLMDVYHHNHAMLWDYGLAELFTAAAECRKIIYDAWTFGAKND